jgi:D-alanyl-D-alanine carboxypeptidase
MLWQGTHKGGDQYRLGIFVRQVGDREFYWHSGFWGTIAYYDPANRIAVAGITTDQSGFKPLVTVVEGVIGAVR